MGKMAPLLPEILTQIDAADPTLGLRLRSYVEKGDAAFHERAESFFARYAKFLAEQGLPLSFGVDHFVYLHHSLAKLRDEFLASGKYRNSSFDEVNRDVYSNAENMQRHMHGLVLAQFLWPDQYERFRFFADALPGYRPTVKRYLEIGGGHALYLSEAAKVLAEATVEVVDVSATSLEMARTISQQPRIRYHHMDVFDFPDGEFDFITMGEVLEHVEKPRELLAKIGRMLAPNGTTFITTPANAPMVDHIYLFRNAQEIRDMLRESGFEIVAESRHYGVNVKESIAERMKLPLMYAAFLKRAA
jgi:2-polyprenyl-3-methyl-5-hydroxy-6-metoxy-1,4-benzoquinol methylase